jgi:hypothetical protein
MIDVINRWKFITNELKNEGISVAFISTDGAPTLLGAMKYLTKFGTITDVCGMKFPLKPTSAFPCLQDPIHTLNKMKNKLINDSDELFIGPKLASAQHLIALINDTQLTKLDHGLLRWDVDSSDKTKDKMDFSSTLRICDDKVLDLLRMKRSCTGTYMYLKMMNSFAKAFVLESVSVDEKISNSVFVVTFLRIWRKYLELHNLPSDHFISKNCWDCIELCNSFLIFTSMKERGHLIHLCNSQSCESFFRDLRSFSSSGLTQINFNLFDCVKKINKVQTVEILKSELRKFGVNVKVKYDQLERSTSSDSLDNSMNENTQPQLNNVFSRRQLEIAIQLGRQLARMNAVICDIENDEVALAQHFMLPNLEASLRNQNLRFFEKYHNTFEIEYEDIPLIDGELNGTFLIYKNLKLLNIPQGAFLFHTFFKD